MHQKYLEELEERFLRYVRIDTQSASGSTETPSTSQQLDLLRLLESELKMLGAEEVVLTDYGCVLATIPATVGSYSGLTGTRRHRYRVQCNQCKAHRSPQLWWRADCSARRSRSSADHKERSCAGGQGG